MANKKKVTTAVVAGVTAAALLLGGTFAWQSINQTALNEAADSINPGGRLHDDFNGENKDVYVENFADETIFARIRLDEYFEIVMNQGTDAEKTEVVVGGAKGDTSTYATHYFDAEDAADSYWDWTTGGSTTYMPTFNKDKDSLEADINGTYAGLDGDPDAGTPYDDYEDVPVEKTADAIYDADTDNLPDGEKKYVEETHYATETLDATLFSMEEWKNQGSPVGEYWVYDADGWVYWANAIEPGTATGLLLDGISLNQVMDDSWYYAINVVAQFVTADDLGKTDGTGFYDTDNGTAPSADALALLKKIGVDVPITNADELKAALNADDDVELNSTIANDVASQEYGNRNYNYLWTEGGTLEGGALDMSGAYWGMFINSENNWPVEGDGAYEAIVDGTKFTSTGENAAVYTQAIDAPITLQNAQITSDRVGVWDEYAGETLTLENCTVTSLNNADATYPWLNSAIAVASNGNIVINSGTYTGENAVYVFSSGGTIEINGGTFNGEIINGAGNKGSITIKGGTFTVDPSDFVAAGYEAIENGDGTWTVQEKAAVGLTYTVVSPENWDGALARRDENSVTLKVDGDYTADDLEWSCEDAIGATCVNSTNVITVNADGSATIMHTGTICGGGGFTVRVSLTSNPDVYLDIYIGCDS